MKNTEFRLTDFPDSLTPDLLSADLLKYKLPDFRNYPVYNADELEPINQNGKFSYRKISPGTFLWFKHKGKYVIGRLLVSISDIRKRGIEVDFHGLFDHCVIVFFEGIYNTLDEVTILKPLSVTSAIEPGAYRIYPEDDLEIGTWAFRPLAPEDITFPRCFSYTSHKRIILDDDVKLYKGLIYTEGELYIELPIAYMSIGDIKRKNFGIWKKSESDPVFFNSNIRGTWMVGTPTSFDQMIEYVFKLNGDSTSRDEYLSDEYRMAGFSFDFQPNLKALIYKLLNRPLDMNYYDYAKSKGLNPNKFIY
ncbi:MAG: hypothetical protein EP332_01635 [Bacteroidetes bacterium]|nr:MAG: hypothetical protein EP332_01635 [Bacteroidota bacterium]